MLCWLMASTSEDSAEVADGHIEDKRYEIKEECASKASTDKKKEEANDSTHDCAIKCRFFLDFARDPEGSDEGGEED